VYYNYLRFKTFPFSEMTWDRVKGARAMAPSGRRSAGPHRVARLAAAAVLLGLGLLVDGAAAQTPQVEIPFLSEWASSPHAKRDARAFTYWDKDGSIPEVCARCHSTSGFLDYLGVDGSTEWKVDSKPPTGEVVACVACHNRATRFLSVVHFPSGLSVHDVGAEARCMACHQGRASTVSVNAATEGMGADEISDKIAFINIHYRAAAATRFGTLAKGGYEYPDRAYQGFYKHDEGASTCIDCHSPHTTKVSFEHCTACHREVRTAEDLKKVRKLTIDADGDGNTTEGIAEEIDTLHKALMAAIQSYAKEVGGKAIAYHSHNHPYFFIDTNGNGIADPEEAQGQNRYNAWTPRLLRAAYNYQFVAKDPGAYAHNSVYILQILHDSLVDLGTKVRVAMDGMARP